jgi:DNA-binding protein YbaB
MLKEKEEIDNTIFEGKSSFVSATVYGNKKIKSIKIENDSISEDEIELLEDMIVIAINNAMEQIDKATEEKMGKYTKGMPGLF